jgi:hypothetical protein
MAELSLRDGSSLILVARNSDSLKVIKADATANRIIRLRADEVSAEITYGSGEKEIKEFNYGSGYLSHSSRICRVPPGAESVVITNYRGVKRTIRINKH